MMTPHKRLKKLCDKLWAECIKLRAGGKSEYSGKTERLHAHHIVGKSCYRLRYELLNGVCLTAGEHCFIAHRADRYETFRKFVKRVRGEAFYEQMDILKAVSSPPDLRLIKLYLEKEKEKLTNVL